MILMFHDGSKQAGRKLSYENKNLINNIPVDRLSFTTEAFLLIKKTTSFLNLQAQH